MLSLGLLAWLLWRAGMPLQIDRNEAWNAWHQAHAFSLTQLYPPMTALVINNYPPLSFVMLASLSGGVDPILVGRGLSVIALIVVAVSVGFIVRAVGVSRAWAVYAGVWCVALFAGLFPNYVGMDDPSMLALSVMMMGVAVCVCAVKQQRSLLWSGLCMVVALFFKLNLLALPAALFIWLWRQDRRQAMHMLGYGLVFGLLGLGLCRALYGPVFMAQLLAPRQIVWLNGFKLFKQFVPMLPVLLLWWQWRPETVQLRRARDLVNWMLIVSFCWDFFQRCAPGVDYNAQFELAVAVAVALGLAGAHLRSTRTWALLNVVLLASLLIFSNRAEPLMFYVSPSYRAQVEAQVIEADSEVARIKALPGRVACDRMTTCYRAGRPFEYDDFGMRQRVLTGVWSQAQLDQALAEREIQRVSIDERAEWIELHLSDWISSGSQR